MSPNARLVLSVLVVALTPAFAWLVWISPSEGLASDLAHVAWFATVAVGVLVAGVVAPAGALALGALWPVSVVSTMGTLFLWWSSVDESGLFMVGLIVAFPPVVGAAPLLVMLGRRLSRMGSVRNPS